MKNNLSPSAKSGGKSGIGFSTDAYYFDFRNC